MMQSSEIVVPPLRMDALRNGAGAGSSFAHSELESGGSGSDVSSSDDGSLAYSISTYATKSVRTVRSRQERQAAAAAAAFHYEGAEEHSRPRLSEYKLKLYGDDASSVASSSSVRRHSAVHGKSRGSPASASSPSNASSNSSRQRVTRRRQKQLSTFSSTVRGETVFDKADFMRRKARKSTGESDFIATVRGEQQGTGFLDSDSGSNEEGYTRQEQFKRVKGMSGPLSLEVPSDGFGSHAVYRNVLEDRLWGRDIQELVRQGNDLRRLGSFNEAIEVYEELHEHARGWLKRNKSKKDSDEMASFNSLASLAMNGIALCFRGTDQHEQAQAAFRSAIKYAEQGKDSTGGDLASIWHNRAIHMQDLGRMDTALDFFDRAVHTSNLSIPEAAMVASSSRCKAASIHAELKRFDEAAKQYRAAIRACRTARRAAPASKILYHVGVCEATTLSSLVELNRRRLPALQAVQGAEEAVKFWREVWRHAKGRPARQDEALDGLLSSLCTLAQMHSGMSSTAEAMRVAKAAASKVDKEGAVGPKTERRVVAVMCALSRIAFSCGKFSDALSAAEKGLKLLRWKKSSSKRRLSEWQQKQVPGMLCLRAQALRRSGEFESSCEDYENAALLAGELNGEASASVATVLNNQGACLMDMKRWQSAKDCFQRALKIAQAVYGDNGPNLIPIVNNIAEAERGLQNTAGVSKALHEAMRLSTFAEGGKEQNVSPSVLHPDIADALTAKSTPPPSLPLAVAGGIDVVSKLKSRVSDIWLQHFGEGSIQMTVHGLWGIHEDLDNLRLHCVLGGTTIDKPLQDLVDDAGTVVLQRGGPLQLFIVGPHHASSIIHFSIRRKRTLGIAHSTVAKARFGVETLLKGKSVAPFVRQAPKGLLWIDMFAREKHAKSSNPDAKRQASLLLHFHYELHPDIVAAHMRQPQQQHLEAPGTHVEATKMPTSSKASRSGPLLPPAVPADVITMDMVSVKSGDVGISYRESNSNAGSSLQSLAITDSGEKDATTNLSSPRRGKSPHGSQRPAPRSSNRVSGLSPRSSRAPASLMSTIPPRASSPLAPSVSVSESKRRAKMSTSRRLDSPPPLPSGPPRNSRRAKPLLSSGNKKQAAIAAEPVLPPPPDMPPPVISGAELTTSTMKSYIMAQRKVNSEDSSSSSAGSRTSRDEDESTSDGDTSSDSSHSRTEDDKFVGGNLSRYRPPPPSKHLSHLAANVAADSPLSVSSSLASSSVLGSLVDSTASELSSASSFSSGSVLGSHASTWTRSSVSESETGSYTSAGSASESSYTRSLTSDSDRETSDSDSETSDSDSETSDSDSESSDTSDSSSGTGSMYTNSSSLAPSSYASARRYGAA